jgi:hypothetical protein
MIKPEASDPRLSLAVCRLLDTAVDQRCLELNASYNVPMELDETTGIPSIEEVRAANDTLLNFAFVCDARAQVDNPESPSIKTAWVEVAQKGIRRMALKIPTAKRLDRMLLLTEADFVEQRQIYDEMAAIRMAAHGDDVGSPTGLWYAVRVATGQIILEESSSQISQKYA